MTSPISEQQLLDALRLTDESATLLQYALWTKPLPLTAGGKATLTLTISNGSRNEVTCTKIKVTIPVGSNAKDLAASSDIGYEQVTGWDIVPDSGTFTLTPAAGSTVFKDASVSFVFNNIIVNDQPGTATLTIWETAKIGDDTPASRKGTMPVPKFPATFELDGPRVTPDSIASGGTTEVMWQGSGGNATYVLGYDRGDGAGYKEYGVSHIGPHKAENLTISPYLFFTLKVAVLPSGETTPIELKKSVHVNVAPRKPAVTSASGTFVNERQVKLSWTTRNADQVRISGFATPFNPTGTTDPFDNRGLHYTLIAHDTPSRTDSDPLTIAVKWGVVASVQVAPRASRSRSRLFLAPDGASLIVLTCHASDDLQHLDWRGSSGCVVDAANLSVRTFHSQPNDDPHGTPAVSRDGKRLLFALIHPTAGAALTVRTAPDFASGPAVNIGYLGGSTVNWSTFSPDGSRVYIVGAGSFELNVRSTSDMQPLAPDLAPIPCAGPLEMSADGKHLYIAATGRVVVLDATTASVVATIPLSQGYVYPSTILFDPQEKRLYIADSGNGLVEALDVANFKHLGTAKVGSEPWGPVLSPQRTEIVVARRLSKSLAMIDTTTFGVSETPLDEPAAALAFSRDGLRLYVLTFSGKLVALKMTSVG